MARGGCVKRSGPQSLVAPVTVATAARTIQVTSVAAVVHVKVEDVKVLLLAQRPSCLGLRFHLRTWYSKSQVPEESTQKATCSMA